jgi:hypothetical protein
MTLHTTVTTKHATPAQPRTTDRAPEQSPAEIAALEARAVLAEISDLLVRYFREGSR